MLRFLHAEFCQSGKTSYIYNNPTILAPVVCRLANLQTQVSHEVGLVVSDVTFTGKFIYLKNNFLT